MHGNLGWETEFQNNIAVGTKNQPSDRSESG